MCTQKYYIHWRKINPLKAMNRSNKIAWFLCKIMHNYLLGTLNLFFLDNSLLFYVRLDYQTEAGAGLVLTLDP
jgi:hypothetical protein